MLEDVSESLPESRFLQSHLHEHACCFHNLDLALVVGKRDVDDVFEDLSWLFVFSLAIVAMLIINKY